MATEDNYGYHLGNTIEDWMQEEYAKLKYEDKRELEPTLKTLKRRQISYNIKSKLFRKLITFKPFLSIFLKRKGVPKRKVNQYLNDKA